MTTWGVLCRKILKLFTFYFCLFFFIISKLIYFIQNILGIFINYLFKNILIIIIIYIKV